MRDALHQGRHGSRTGGDEEGSRDRLLEPSIASTQLHLQARSSDAIQGNLGSYQEFLMNEARYSDSPASSQSTQRKHFKENEEAAMAHMITCPPSELYAAEKKEQPEE